MRSDHPRRPEYSLLTEYHTHLRARPAFLSPTLPAKFHVCISNGCEAIVLTRFCWLSGTDKHLPIYSQPLIWWSTLLNHFLICWYTTFAVEAGKKKAEFVKKNKKYVLSNSESVQCNFFIFWSRDVHPVQNILLWTKFHENRMIFHWDTAIYRFSKWRPSAISELFYHHTRPPTLKLPVKFHTNLIQRSEEFSYIWLEVPIQAPKWGFWGTLDP